MSKTILIFGASGFISKKITEHLSSDQIKFLEVHRNSSSNNALRLDFTDPKSVEKFELPEGTMLDGIFFLQGINPSKNTKEMNYAHFLQMLEVNIITPTLLIKKLHNKLNKDALILFISSIAAKKGSYDPSYAAAKSAMNGLIQTLSNEFNNFRFNILSLGLVEDSPVYNQMTSDFREKHATKMYNNSFIKIENIIRIVDELLKNENISRATIPLIGGYIT